MAKSSGRESDPLPGFSFSLSIQNQVQALFSEVSGIGSENEVIDHKIVTKTGQEVVQKIPGRLKWTEITLKRGITDELALWKWRENVELGKMKDSRKDCSIIMYDRDYKASARWDIVNAWPSKITGPSVKADSNEFGIEEVVLQHEGMKRVAV